MVDPQLDEARIHNVLTDPSIEFSPMGVRSLMSLVLLACYDRKVKREFMAEMLDVSADIGIVVAQLEAAAKLRAAMIELRAGISTDKIDEQISELAKAWSAKRAHVARKFDLLRQCPTSADRIS